MAITEMPQDLPSQSAAPILESLEPGQLAQAKRRHIPRRQLRPGQIVLLWALRLYLFFMLAVVIYQVWTGA